MEGATDTTVTQPSLGSVFFHPFKVIRTTKRQEYNGMGPTKPRSTQAHKSGMNMNELQDVFFNHIAGSGVPIGERHMAEPSEITSVRFGVMSPREIKAMAVVRVTVADTTPGLAGSLSDPRMGPAHGHNSLCRTCLQDYQSCPGHFGYISLATPVYNPMFIAMVVKLLNILCIHCHRLRMSHVWLQLNHPLPGRVVQHHVLLGRIRLLAVMGSRQAACVHCDQALGVFRLASNRLSIEYQPHGSPGYMAIPIQLVHYILTQTPDKDIRQLGLDPVHNHPVNMIMLHMPVLPIVCRPSTRSQRYTSSSNDQNTIECEDDLTRELHTLVTLCNQCEYSPLLLSNEEIECRYEDIQTTVERIVLDANKGVVNGRRRNQARLVTDSVRKRWAGKIGRVRREVMGKRVNFCARTVVTCDSSIRVDEIGVPYAVLQRITHPCPVNPYNIDEVSRRMHRGDVVFLTREGTTRHISFIAQQTLVLGPSDTIVREGRRYSPFHGHRCPVLPLAITSNQPILHIPINLKSSDQRLTILIDDIIVRDGKRIRPLQTIVWPQLQAGDVVLVNPGLGDSVLFNRQPTLVEESMLGMRIRPLPIKSFACTCAPMEAMRGDYDGDEVNLHFPQGPHTVAEVDGLLGIGNQVVTGQSSRPVVRLIHDAVVGCFWLTCGEFWGLRTFEKHLWNQMAASSFMTAGEISDRMTYNKLRWKEYVTETVAVHGYVPSGCSDWERSGLALLSLFLPRKMEYLAPPLVGSTLELLNRYHPVVVRPLRIRNGILVSGVCDSSTLNGRDGVVRFIYKYHGQAAACSFISNIQVVTAYLTYVGFNNSIGMDDCCLPLKLQEECKDSVMNTAIVSLDEARRSNSDTPYMVHRQLFESLLQVRRGCETSILEWALKRKYNAEGASMGCPVSMRLNQFALLAVLGTKGSVSNMMQTVQSLGQQVIEGTEVQENWTGRTLPHEVLQNVWTDHTVHQQTSMFAMTHRMKYAPQERNEEGGKTKGDSNVSINERSHTVQLERAKFRGLVFSSFAEGLDPVEFFWHAAAGREALVEGATSTATSGYAMRYVLRLLSLLTPHS